MHGSLITFALSVFTAFLAVMNPLTNMPIFLSLVGDEDKETQKKIAAKACVTAFFIIVVSVVAGNTIFKLFGITIPAFKIAGGFLLAHIGFEMLQSKPRQAHTTHAPIDDSVAISPIAIPLMAGPGTIVTAMGRVSDHNYIHIIITIAMFAILCILTYLTFIGANRIIHILGQNMILVIGKLMGLIISIIGVDMIISGIKLAFHLTN